MVSAFNFSPIRPAMQRYVDQGILAGVSSALLHGQELVYQDCVGWANIEQAIPLREDHLFRVFSNTKLITSIAVMCLAENGTLQLDMPIAVILPQLGHRRVLLPHARHVDETVATSSQITVRHLLCHSSGLGYGLFDRGSLLYDLYVQRKVFDPFSSLENLIDILADLPLNFEPGTAWQYSIASDVLARAIEVVTGLRFEDFLQQTIFDPLDMRDTFFTVPPEKQARLVAYYAGSDPMNRLRRPLKLLAEAPYAQANLQAVARHGGGSGLVSSLPDMMKLVRCLMPNAHPALLSRESISTMMTNQLPQGVGINFPTVGAVPNKGFGLGGAVTLAEANDDPPDAAGEFEWGGIAGTHWWISPRHNTAGILMAQRKMAFWHPFSFEFKRLAYAALRTQPHAP